MGLHVALRAAQRRQPRQLRQGPRRPGERPQGRAVEHMLGVARDQLEQPDEVARTPLARHEALARAELSTQREPPEPALVEDLEHDRVAVVRPEAPALTVRKAQLERPLRHLLECAEQHAAGDRRRCRQPQRAPDGTRLGAHPAADPRAGSKAGLL